MTILPLVLLGTRNFYLTQVVFYVIFAYQIYNYHIVLPLKKLAMKEDVIPYLIAWSVLFIAYLLFALWDLERNSEGLCSNTDTASKQKYHNKMMLTVAMVFMWIAGLGVILACYEFTKATLFIISFALFGMLGPLSSMKRVKNA